jgi:hypothetical protein
MQPLASAIKGLISDLRAEPNDTVHHKAGTRLSVDINSQILL